MRTLIGLSCFGLIACAGDAQPPASAGGLASEVGAVTYRGDVTQVTRAADAQKGVFIPPYAQCVAPKDGRPGQGPDGKVCSNVAISGATESGRYFPEYASCDVVVTQRPYWPAPPAGSTKAGDPRLADAAYLAELAWVRDQIAATGCTCCHDANAGRAAAQWDIRAEPIWIDTLSNSGLALFAGLADSSVLGAYAAADNFGFDRTATGIPSNDSARMKRFMVAELGRRGISEAQARAVPPFGGPIYAAQVTPPTACTEREGIDAEGRVRWSGGTARYAYLLDAQAKNPGVPPNLDLPAGTLWRLDALASSAPFASGVPFGSTPAGTFQSFPARVPAAPLVEGTTYHLTVLRDVGLPIANCLFTYGDHAVTADAPAAPDAGAPTAAADASTPSGAACTLPGGDASGFGATCKADADCTCAASFCAVQPGQPSGYCTQTGCSASDLSMCPSGWSCFDLSRFVPGQPAFCAK